MASPKYETRKSYYTEMWKDCKINLGEQTATAVAKRLLAAKSRYVAVSKKTGVPWEFIAVAHQRESSQSWTRSLAQGDPWNQKSVHVPKNRGPFNSWEEAAEDALVNLKHLDKVKDWTIERILYHLEEYNGWGYANKGKPSPYLWSHTNKYTGGKYVADHVYDPNVYDQQLGCVAVLKKVYELDKVSLGGPVVPVGTGTAAAATYWPEYLPIILATGGLIIVGYFVYKYIKRNK